MQHPGWLNEEADRNAGFWKRHYGVAIEADDASVEALLSSLERQLGDEDQPQIARDREGT